MDCNYINPEGKVVNNSKTNCITTTSARPEQSSGVTLHFVFWICFVLLFSCYSSPPCEQLRSLGKFEQKRESKNAPLGLQVKQPQQQQVCLPSPIVLPLQRILKESSRLIGSLPQPPQPTPRTLLPPPPPHTPQLLTRHIHCGCLSRFTGVRNM